MAEKRGTSDDNSAQPWDIRRGDPRMNLAVAARLEHPELTVFQCLRHGGFSYVADDADLVDEENITLAQRKNQLSRRMRKLRRRDSPSSGSEQAAMGSSKKRKSQQKSSGGSAKASSGDGDTRIPAGVPKSDEKEGGHEQKLLRQPSEQRIFQNSLIHSNNSQQFRFPQSAHHGSLILEGTGGSTQESAAAVPAQAYSSSSAAGARNYDGYSAAAAAAATANPTGQQLPEPPRHHHQLGVPISGSSVASRPVQHSSSSGDSALNLNVESAGPLQRPPNFHDPATAQHLMLIDQRQTMFENQLQPFFPPQGGGNNAIPGVANFFPPHQHHQQYHDHPGNVQGIAPQIISPTTALNYLQQKDHREMRAIQLFTQELDSVRQRCMVSAGYSATEVQTSSPAFQRFAFFSWQHECERLQRSLGNFDPLAMNHPPAMNNPPPFSSTEDTT